MSWAISGFTRMHFFSFLQHFNPVHVPSQSSLKIHLAMSSLLSLSLKLQLELSFFLQLVYPSTLLSFQNYPSPWLIVTTPCCTWIRHPPLSSTLMNIRLYCASRTYRTAFRARTNPSLPVILTVSVLMILQAEPPTILTISFSFAIRSRTYPYENMHEPYYQNQISCLYLEKCCLQRRKPLILRC